MMQNRWRREGRRGCFYAKENDGDYQQPAKKTGNINTLANAFIAAVIANGNPINRFDAAWIHIAGCKTCDLAIGQEF